MQNAQSKRNTKSKKNASDTSKFDLALAYIDATLKFKGHMPACEVDDVFRPFVKFDPDKAYQKEVRQKSISALRKIKGSDGERRAYVIKGENVVVDIENCQSLDEMGKIVDNLGKQRQSITSRHNVAKKMYKQLEGQLMLAAFAEEDAK